MRTLYTLLLTLLALHTAAQGEITGVVLDEKKTPVFGAIVTVLQGGITKGASTTDFDGNYIVKPLDPGTYTLTVSYINYATVSVENIIVGRHRVAQDINMAPVTNEIKEIKIKWKRPLIIKQPSSATQEKEELKSLATTEVVDVASITPSVYQQKRGAPPSIGGGRKPGTLYIIDGVQVSGSGTYAWQNGPTPNTNTTEYRKYEESGFKAVSASPLSTLSVDVDRASYANVRRYINEGQLPPADAVRIEEMVNYFEYDYGKPRGTDPITLSGELTECPWNEEHLLLRLGILASRPETDNLPAGNFVFLVDVSGSMNQADKLPLLVSGLKLLVNQMRPIDRISIVAYAGAAGMVLPPTPGNNKAVILEALNKLHAGGSTAGGQGIMLAYKTAEEHFIKGGTNRVILATDGDFNVGISNENELERLIVQKRESGVYLTCLGFGHDNLKDSKLEMLADKGNGNYHYIDGMEEAEKSLVKEFGGTMFTVAKDVKAQVEFNRANVQAYRLVGYDNRMLNAEDFKNDKKDAGDMGAGHTVTILYEIIPAGSKSPDIIPVDNLKYATAQPGTSYSNELATVKFRYKKPDGNKSTEMEYTIANRITDWRNATDNTWLAATVAMFGMLLKESQYCGDASYKKAVKMAGACSESNDENRAGFLKLVKEAKAISEKTSGR